MCIALPVFPCTGTVCLDLTAADRPPASERFVNMTLGSHTLGWAFTFLLCFTLFNGTWGECGLPERISYAEPKQGALDPGKTFPPNATVSYNCRPGYTRVHDKKTSITCLEDGTWSTPEVFCQLRSCGYPGELSNGDFEAVDFLFGSTVIYTCNEGFRLSNRRNVRQCQADGTWSNVVPQCDEVICAAPESPANGEYHPQKEEYTYLDSVTFSCRNPLEVAGDASISCTGTGEWSSNSPTCKAVNCPNPNVKNSRRLSGFTGPYTLNSAISFECDKDFVLRGSGSISCNIDSQWIPAIPLCERRESKPVNCPDPHVKNSRRLSGFTGPYTLKSVILFECDEGFHLEGSSSITCNSYSEWEPAIPYCKEYTQVWKIVAIVVGVIGALAVICFVLYKFVYKKQKRGKMQSDNPVQYSHCSA